MVPQNLLADFCCDDWHHDDQGWDAHIIPPINRTMKMKTANAAATTKPVAQGLLNRKHLLIQDQKMEILSFNTFQQILVPVHENVLCFHL